MEVVKMNLNISKEHIGDMLHDFNHHMIVELKVEALNTVRNGEKVIIEDRPINAQATIVEEYSSEEEIENSPYFI
jgi:hypothetical protein